MAVFQCLLVSHLPRAVHLVAHAPELDAVGVLVAVPAAKVCIVGIGVQVAVLQEVQRIGGASRAEVHCHHDAGIGLLCPLGELVDADEIRLVGSPGQVQPCLSLCHRSYGILPVEVGDKVAARVPDDRNVELAHKVDDVPAEAQLIGGRMLRLVDAVVHRSTQVLDEGAVDPLIYLSDFEILIYNEFSLACHIILPKISTPITL